MREGLPISDLNFAGLQSCQCQNFNLFLFNDINLQRWVWITQKRTHWQLFTYLWPDLLSWRTVHSVRLFYSTNHAIWATAKPCSKDKCSSATIIAVSHCQSLLVHWRQLQVRKIRNVHVDNYVHYSWCSDVGMKIKLGRMDCSLGQALLTYKASNLMLENLGYRTNSKP